MEEQPVSNALPTKVKTHRIRIYSSLIEIIRPDNASGSGLYRRKPASLK